MVGERGFEPPTPWSRTRKQPFFEIRKNQELEEVENAAVTHCCFGADSKKLKTRRAPPTETPSTGGCDQTSQLSSPQSSQGVRRKYLGSSVPFIGSGAAQCYSKTL